MAKRAKKTRRGNKSAEDLEEKIKKTAVCPKVVCLDKLFFEAGIISGKIKRLFESK